MAICEFCGEEEETTTKCKTCGIRFCEYCGSVEDKQCVECLEYSDDDDKAEDDDDEKDSDWR
jgi:hypothetical protein